MVRVVKRSMWVVALIATGLVLACPSIVRAAWNIGEPITAYWNGPGTLLWGEHFGSLNDAAAKQLAAGGFNVALANSCDEVRIAQAHGLRTMYQSDLLTPASLDNPSQRAKLDAMVDQLRELPAHYAYLLKDEPTAAEFADLGRLADYLRKRDPEHLAYVSLLPNYASSAQLGAKDYQEYLDRFVQTVHPSLLSYDHYQFTTSGDSPRYLSNLAAVAQAAKQAGIPFVNVVQACSWAPTEYRVPNAGETRFLVYTTLAYGAQGISYFQYTEADAPQIGGIIRRDGTPMPIYPAIQAGNREFINIAKQYRSLQWIGAYLQGYGPVAPLGALPVPADSAFKIEGVSNEAAYRDGDPLKGLMLGLFGEKGVFSANATLALVVNLDYASAQKYTIVGPADLSIFDATSDAWTATHQRQVALDLPPGGGVLVGVTSELSSNTAK